MSMEMQQARLRLVESRRKLMELAQHMQNAERTLREIQDDASSVIAGKIQTDAVRALYDATNGALTQHENLRTFLAIMHRHLTDALRGLG